MGMNAVGLRPSERTARGIARRRVEWLKETRSLNALLAMGLVSINLVAFGTFYWWSTRDVLAEVSGEVLAEWIDAPRTASSQKTGSTRKLKRSSLSTGAGPVSEDNPSSELALPLPPPRMTEPKPPAATTRQKPPAPTVVLDAPLTSPDTAPAPEKTEVRETSALKRPDPRRDESP